MTSYIAYGIDTTSANFKLKPDALKLLWKKAEKIDWIKEKYEEYCEDNNLDLEGRFEEDFINDYEDDATLESGFEALLTEVINELEDTVERSFVYEDGCIAVPASIPANDTKRACMLTQQRIREIFVKYINPLIEEPVIIDWYTIYDE